MADDAPEIPDDQQVPDAGQSSAQDLGLGQGSLTPQPVLKPPSSTQGYGMPALIGMIGQMIHPTATLQPGQMPRTPSRLDAFENFLGQFTSSLASGMAASGRGPGSNLRGAAAALQAPHQRALEDYTLQATEQNRQAQLAKEQAQTEAIRANAQLVPVSLPDGTQIRLPANLAKTMIDAQTSAASRQSVQLQKNVSAEKVQGMKGATQQALATKSLAEKADEFQQSQAYKTWKTKFDAETQTKIAQMRIDAQKAQQVNKDNKAPAALMQTAVFAGGGLKMMQEADAAMQRLEQRGVMGSLPANKVQDWIFGKGLVDPSLDAETRNDIGKLRAALGYTSSAAMRAHTGRTSNEIYQDFKARLGAGQDWSALRGAMDETKTLLGEYATAASDASIQAIRQGTNVPPAGGSKDPVQSLVDKYKGK